MQANGHGPQFSVDDLKPVSIPMSIYVAGYQADTSNSIEYNAAPGTSPIARVIQKMTQEPLEVGALHPHPAGQMASAYTHFINLDTQDPLYRYTMGLRVEGFAETPDDIGIVEIPAGEFLCLTVPGPFHATIPAAWSWLINQFADRRLPWVRTYTGDVELYDFGLGTNDALCAIYVAVKPVS